MKKLLLSLLVLSIIVISVSSVTIEDNNNEELSTGLIERASNSLTTSRTGAKLRAATVVLDAVSNVQYVGAEVDKRRRKHPRAKSSALKKKMKRLRRKLKKIKTFS